ncbi:MAG TPA: hypothetical protein VHX38_32155 [Pseudonocardiaceae bacterium]|jgi:hypothetical protein|nr:hypothetical protein [Pseudonocardiaceae bacterium]
MVGGNGIAMDTWVAVEDDCRLECEVVGEHAQFTFGSSGEVLMLAVGEDSLARFVSMAEEALTRWRVIPIGAEVNFRVIAPTSGIMAGQELDRGN